MALNTSLPGTNTIRKVSLVAGIFAIAMGVGFFMQQSGAEAAYTASMVSAPVPVSPDAASEGATPVPALATAGDTPALIEEVAMAPVPPEEAVASAALGMAGPGEETLDAFTDASDALIGETPDLAAAAGGCEPQMSADVRNAALVMLSIYAPCNAGEVFTLHHEGMMFSAQTASDGNASLMAPALSADAIFIAAFEGGVGALAEADVPAVEDYARVVLQWRGAGGFEIHAMEYGANYGEPGHVWYDAPRTASAAAAGEGGFLMALGDGRVAEPRFAQVYTFPILSAPRAGTVALSVEAEVTAVNCATEMDAQTLERTEESGLKIVDLTLSLPECEAIGDFLVLKNLLSDLTLQTG
ncbi:MAG: hypothetical protein AAF841_10510 [Pseudomonadota bacterium]